MQETKLGLCYLIKWIINSILYYLFNITLFTIKIYNSPKKRIYWECGGGYASYYLGISQAIYELYPPEIIENIEWLGVSAGIFPVLVLQCKIPPIKLFEYVKTNILSHLSSQILEGFYNLNKYAENTLWVDFFSKYQTELLHTTRFSIIYFNYNFAFPFLSYFSFSSNFNSIDELAKSALSSHNIPFITGITMPHPTNPFIRRFDAGVLTLIYGYLMGYDILPYQNIGIIKCDTFRKLEPLRIWLWTEVEYNEELYKMGYNDAITNKTILDKIII
jgi:hypothetical protein